MRASLCLVLVAAALLARAAMCEGEPSSSLRGGRALLQQQTLPKQVQVEQPKQEPQGLLDGPTLAAGTVADLPGVFDKRTASYVTARNNASSGEESEYNKASVSQAALDAYRQAHEKAAMQLSQRWRLTKAEADAVGDPALAGKIRVCVNPNTPYTFCNHSDPQTPYSGFEVELFKDIARRVPWLGDDGLQKEWAFQCVPFADLDHDEPDGKCMLSIGGLLATNHLDSGSKSSQSIAEDGYLILVRAKASLSRNRLFSPFTAFTWQLWVALICTAVAVAVVLWVFDTVVRATFHYVKPEAPAEQEAAGDASAKGAAADDAKDAAAAVAAAAAAKPEGANGAPAVVDGKDVDDASAAAAAAAPAAADEAAAKPTGLRRTAHRARKLMHRAYGSHSEARANLDKATRMMLLNLARVTTPPPSTSLPSQIVLFAWGILTMITVSMFTAATAAGLTTAALTDGVNNLADLRGRRVVVWNAREKEFKSTGILTVPMAANTIEDEQAMLRRLRSYDADAIIMDSRWVQYYAGTRCDLVSVGKPWSEKYITFAFNTRLQQPLIDDINAAIVLAKEDGSIAMIENALIPPHEDCGQIRTVAKGSTTVHFDQVAGLWVMLAIAMVAGAVLVGLRLLNKRKLKPKAAELALRVKSRAALVATGAGGLSASFGARSGRKAGGGKGAYTDIVDV